MRGSAHRKTLVYSYPMDRRTFLLGTTLSSQLEALAEAPMPMGVLGKTGMKVSRFTVGGYHMRVNGELTGIRIIQRAVALGVNFFDSAHHYHKGESDITYGKALKGGLRQKVLVMTKAQKRDKASAMQQLEESLQRLQTDYLDLWQCHEVSKHEEVDQIFGPNGALEAFVQAKKQGKVRHIGFTGHHDPAVHQRLLDGFDGWETVQHPVNLIDPHYLSFINSVMPNIRKKRLGLIAMKSNAMGQIGKQNVASIDDCLRFAWSQNIDTLVSGVETVEQLEHNVLACKIFQPMSEDEKREMLARTKRGLYGSKVERYKKADNIAHHSPHRDGQPA
jgi:uncharacterized protein